MNGLRAAIDGQSEAWPLPSGGLAHDAPPAPPQLVAEQRRERPALQRLDANAAGCGGGKPDEYAGAGGGGVKADEYGSPVVVGGELHYPPHPKQLASAQYMPPVRLPSTARRNPITGDWEETDRHRIEQRHKQILFGKVTAGYRNYAAAVPALERQPGNERHPQTPRCRQVCSKRSWDSQVGAWRRALHLWDHQPPPASMRLSDEQLRQKEPAEGRQCRQLQIKCAVRGSQRCKLVVTPPRMAYAPFEQLVQDKVGLTRSLVWVDADGDAVEVDDDDSLASFLDAADAGRAAPKLICDLCTVAHRVPAAVARADLNHALVVLARTLRPADALHLHRALADQVLPGNDEAVVRTPMRHHHHHHPAQSPAMPPLLQASPVSACRSEDPHTPRWLGASPHRRPPLAPA